MTIAKAFNEIAVAQGGTADTSGTIAGAIDALNDALAGSDLPKKPRIEDGIRVLGQYIGGGGASVGPMNGYVISVFATPEVGEDVGGDAFVAEIKLSNKPIVKSFGNIDGFVASGATCVSAAFPDINACEGYICSQDDNFKYTTVELFGKSYGDDPSIGYESTDDGAVFTFVMPELEEGQFAAMYVYED